MPPETVPTRLRPGVPSLDAAPRTPATGAGAGGHSGMKVTPPAGADAYIEAVYAVNGDTVARDLTVSIYTAGDVLTSEFPVQLAVASAATGGGVLSTPITVPATFYAIVSFASLASTKKSTSVSVAARSIAACTFADGVN